MPYTRPDRKGLPSSDDDEESSEIPRSESYLRLSELGSSNASQSASAAEPMEQMSNKPPSRKTKTAKQPQLTPPVEASLEHSPSNPGTPDEKVSAKTSSRNTSPVNPSVPSNASLVYMEELTESPPQKTDSGGVSGGVSRGGHSAGVGSSDPRSDHSVLFLFCTDRRTKETI